MFSFAQRQIVGTLTANICATSSTARYLWLVGAELDPEVLFCGDGRGDAGLEFRS
ncbi:hypothetical protein [Roseibium sediminis]|uniref:hypothetical protein n=1 Tax=Roseibium sediminis TaxID=1775174 RepID=UPI0018640387|nr:hypothetical protein [Roseibium sediminis]